MGGMILIFAFVMSLVINFIENIITSNNDKARNNEAETSLVTEQSE